MASGSRAVDPIVLMPAAGKGERFREAGYKTIKPLIRFDLDNVHACMYEHALHGIEEWEVVLGLPRHDMIMEHSGFNVLGVPDSEGQSDTVMALAHHVLGCDGGAPVLVLNSDTQFLGDTLRRFHRDCSVLGAGCGVLVLDRGMLASGTRVDGAPVRTPYSHVDGAPKFNHVREKVFLSKWAIAGAFWFRNVDSLLCGLHGQRARHHRPGERYLSEALEHVPGIHIAMPIADEDFREFGTPALLRELLGDAMPIPEGGVDL